MNIEKRTIAWKGLTLRSADDAGASTVEGVAVPFGDIIDTWDGAETFDRDCSFDGLDEAKLCFEHGETIGRITKAESTDDGLHITARISDTARGRDAMTLIRDGVLDSFSVGFIPIESQKDRDGITHRRKVRLLETSIVSWPAYQNAKMTKSAAPAVEHRKETMENNNELMDLIQSMQEEQRGIKAEITKMGAKPAPAAIGAAYRSHGEYMQALARGDEQAMTVMKECRDLISTKDTGNTATWIADDLKLIEDRRKVSQLLTHDTLPATGMSMEYHVVTSDTTAVGKQETEGSELSFGKVAFGTKTADINTYGGYTTLSRQTIERSTTPMLNTAITALQNAYAKATEKAVRDHLYAEIKAQRDASKDANKIDAPQLANMTIDDWVSLIIDASELADDRNVSLTRLAVSKDVLKALVKLKDTGDRFFNLSGDPQKDVLGTYLVKLSAKHLSVEDNRSVNTLLHTIGDFERVSDHAVNIIKTAQEIRDKGIKFSEEALNDLSVLEAAVQDIVNRTVDAFQKCDTYAAGKIEPLEQVVDGLVREVKTRHIARLQAGACTIEYGFVLDDLLTNYERIADHCSNIAVAMIEVSEDRFDTHEYLNHIKNGESPSFEKRYERYRGRYTFEPGPSGTAAAPEQKK